MQRLLVYPRLFLSFSLALFSMAALMPAIAEETSDSEVVEADSDEFVFALDENGHLVRFDRDIAPILRTHCLDCHGAEDAKADFRIDDRDALLEYIEPGDAEASTLYSEYLTIDDEDMVMPPLSRGGPLSSGELSLIKVWINEGADWPEDYSLAADGEAEETPLPVAPPKSLLGRAWLAQGFLHPATVHFPIALLLFGAAFVVLGWKWPALGTQIPLACLLVGALTAIASTLMGWSFAVEQGYGSWNRFDAAMMEKEVFWHRWSGVIVAVVATVLAVVALLSLRKDSPRMTAIWKVGLLVCAAMVGAVGHQGGEMSYGEDFYPKAWRTLIGAVETVDPPSEPIEVSQ